ncbi:DUF6504 family protein [Lapillicoccus jejuensis]|uniref:DUF6504 domain-containing protein n=1 Tax=Lapillicoccus jejuensis TaxID=402171 RepID=A0A542E5L6_9MICO|nr:DUF6504 family protein [Lapillicoccus jejuensis]TQJ10617.1 hypothetical protein FB458_3746 [Lapillicoccus jejuensis]
MRRYHDPVDVRSVRVTAPATEPGEQDEQGVGPVEPVEPVVIGVDAPPGTPAGSEAEPVLAPQAFIWHDRLYVVRRVLGRWRQRRAWWRDALDPRPGQATGIAVASREQHVWRVEAGPGRLAGVGVFDLVHDDAPQPGEPEWVLVGVSD